MSKDTAEGAELQFAQSDSPFFPLATQIHKLFSDDQALLAEWGRADSDPSFKADKEHHTRRVVQEQGIENFNIAATYKLWGESPTAPDLVKRMEQNYRAIITGIQSIIASNGWPRKTEVGEIPAAEFFFLVGHCDLHNDWRLSLLNAIQEIYKAEGVNPRLYGHLVDRFHCLDDKPQIFGTIMGPKKGSSGEANLYWKLDIDGEEGTDTRRREIGLPGMEVDLQRFRDGATIGPYMTPMKDGKLPNGTDYSLDDVFHFDKACL